MLDSLERSLVRWGLCGLALAGLALAEAGNGRGQVLAQEPTALDAARAMEGVLVNCIARAEKSVVAIARVRKGGFGLNGGGDFDERLRLDRRRFGTTDPEPTNPDFVPQEFATGVVIDRNGYILTNYHVLGDPDENDYFVWVQRRPYQVTEVLVPEKVLAGDPWTDLAVLKVAATDLDPIQMGDASKLRKGMIVIALGNPYAIARDGDVSASWGMVSNLNRSVATRSRGPQPESDGSSLHQFGTLIQTDARLNLGTSGGALVNLDGEMVGLTTSLAAVEGFEQAAGYAIPVDDAFRKTVDTLKQGRQPTFGFLGVQPDHLSSAQRRQGQFGARVLRVVPGTPADAAGIKQDDIITHVNDVKVLDKNILFRELSKVPADTVVKLAIERRDPLRNRRRTTTANVTLSKKYIESERRPFAQISAPTWRGMQVEYPSALPPDYNIQGGVTGDRRGCVAVLDVERDSPSWKAGLRRGQFISHVGNQLVKNPREFFAAIQGVTGDVRLHLLGHREGENTVIVTP